MKHKTLPLLLLALLVGTAFGAKKQRPAVVRLETTAGTIRVELSDETPRHRDNFLRLCREGRLDSTLFHRVIRDFMIQGGDPRSLVKTRDSLTHTLPAEFRLPWLYHVRGALAAAREPDEVNPEMRSSGSQFYIVYGRSWGENSLGKVRAMLDEKGIAMNRDMWEDYLQHGGAPHLDGTYTVFGHVVDGMKVVKEIQAVATDGRDRPLEDVVLLRAVVEQSPDDDWQLVWSDEFDLDGRPDSTVWNFEHGFVRNHEAQWYQEENAWQQGGRLIIEGRRERRPNPTYREGSRQWGQRRPTIDYTSACLTTQGSRTFLYGRLEVRARIPTVGGAWPAIWTLGSGMPWPSCGEIDLMEYYRIDGVPHILANAAWGNDRPYDAVWRSSKVPYAHFVEADPLWGSRFHIWRMDWDEEAIRLYLDDELLNEVPLAQTVNGSIGHATNPFRSPQYILLNLALGGDNGGEIDDTAFPMRYEIDYVRIYQRGKK